MYEPHCRPEILLNVLTEIIGEVVEGKETKIQRIAAREITRIHDLFYNMNRGGDASTAILEFAELTYRLADASAYFVEELRREPEPYSANGILFSALVHLIHIEESMFSWEWLPEQMRALGLSMNPCDELAWPTTREFVTIKGRDGTPRRFYRLF